MYQTTQTIPQDANVAIPGARNTNQCSRDPRVAELSYESADFFPLRHPVISPVPTPVQLLHSQAQQQATRQSIDIALVKKSLDTQRNAGEAVNLLLEQAADLQRQFAGRHLDVKV